MALINAARLIADLRELATIGKLGTGVDRVALSPAATPPITQTPVPES